MTEALPPVLPRLKHLAELFAWFNAGRHLNRVSDPVLWRELEQEQVQYQALFSQLGYQLRLDERGFAWFHVDEASSTINRTSRQFALLFMLIFEARADQGAPLGGFSAWRLDREWLAALYEGNRELLRAEGLAENEVQALLERSVYYGFSEQDNGAWRLLPAVWRYLEQFEALAAQLDPRVSLDGGVTAPGDSEEPA
jgi:hypothetical protein